MVSAGYNGDSRMITQDRFVIVCLVWLTVGNVDVTVYLVVLCRKVRPSQRW